MNTPETQSGGSLKPVGSAISDTDRINWLEAHPLPVEVRGGSDDGHIARAWGIVSATGTLREAIDVIMQPNDQAHARRDQPRT